MNNKVKFSVWLSALCCAGAWAQPAYLPSGSNLTYGASSNNQSIMSSMANPAAAAVLMREESQFRFGLLHVGGGYEIGRVSDLFTQIDSTQQQLTTAQNVPPAVLASGPTAIADYINTQVIPPVNTLLTAFEQDGRFTAFGAAHLPFTPFVLAKKRWGGSWVFDVNGSVIAGMTVLADPINPVTSTDPIVTNAIATGTFTLPPNDSTLLVKAASVRQFSLGYSRSVWQGDSTEDAPAELTAGARLKHYQVDLYRQATKLTDSTSASTTFDLARDYVGSTAWGLDAGVLWNSRHYRVGGWINNLNTPKFQYNSVSTVGYTSAAVLAQLGAEEVYEMKPQLTLEGALFSASQNWVFNLSMDAQAVKDPIGREFQWSTASLAYATDSWWIPGLRVGYRANGAGSQLKYVTAGLTLFKALSLDAAWTPETVVDTSGNSAPRSVMFNLGLQLTF